MARETWIWVLVTGLALSWTAAVVATGGGVLIPALIAGIALTCVTSDRIRARVEDWLARAFSGPVWRQLLVVFFALAFVQMLPYELALLMAGDVLVYLEAAAAVSLIAARTRLTALPSLALRLVAPARRILSRAARRSARPPRLPRRRPRAPDPEDPAWAFA